MRKTAVIVGASRGLGLGLAREYTGRGWRVVATTRGRHDAALDTLAAAAGEALRLVTLDINDAEAAARLGEAIGSDEARLDLLLVSAGIAGDRERPAGRVAPDAFTQVLLTNALAPMQLIEALGGRVPTTGAVVAMSSGLGSVTGNVSGGYDTYRASKAALNTLLRCYAARHRQQTVIAMHPGWVRTAMGGSDAALDVEESARGIAEAIAARAGQPGCVFLDWRGQPIAW